MARLKKKNPLITTGEIMLWLLFTALLVPAGAVGWAIGHYTGHNTVTVTAGATTTAATPTTTAAAAPTTTAAASPTAEGKTVFAANGCGSCHTFQPAGTTGKIGPDLDKAPAADAKKANMPLAAFVRESIVKPDAFIAPGYQKGLMPTTFGSSLTKAQLDALVAFITTK
ncbi:MAG TPA: cytochrome c [Gaiellaceae bacterium]|nr:cytochrome c [Gaiellaceae bacterium]